MSVKEKYILLDKWVELQGTNVQIILYGISKYIVASRPGVDVFLFGYCLQWTGQ